MPIFADRRWIFVPVMSVLRRTRTYAHRAGLYGQTGGSSWRPALANTWYRVSWPGRLETSSQAVQRCMARLTYGWCSRIDQSEKIDDVLRTERPSRMSSTASMENEKEPFLASDGQPEHGPGVQKARLRKTLLQAHGILVFIQLIVALFYVAISTHGDVEAGSSDWTLCE